MSLEIKELTKLRSKVKSKKKSKTKIVFMKEQNTNMKCLIRKFVLRVNRSLRSSKSEKSLSFLSLTTVNTFKPFYSAVAGEFLTVPVQQIPGNQQTEHLPNLSP